MHQRAAEQRWVIFVCLGCSAYACGACFSLGYVDPKEPVSTILSQADKLHLRYSRQQLLRASKAEFESNNPSFFSLLPIICGDACRECYRLHGSRCAARGCSDVVGRPAMRRSTSWHNRRPNSPKRKHLTTSNSERRENRPPTLTQQASSYHWKAAPPVARRLFLPPSSPRAVAFSNAPRNSRSKCQRQALHDVDHWPPSTPRIATPDSSQLAEPQKKRDKRKGSATILSHPFSPHKIAKGKACAPFRGRIPRSNQRQPTAWSLLRLASRPAPSPAEPAYRQPSETSGSTVRRPVAKEAGFGAGMAKSWFQQ